MTTPGDEASRAAIEASAKRRWLIGLCITLVFGGFGAVMAWLAYTDRDRGQAAPAARPSAPATERPDPEPDRKPGHGKDKRDR